MQLRAAKPELKVQDQVSATNGKKLGSATTAQIAIYGITATYVSMESSPALKEQKCYLKSKILFIPELYLKQLSESNPRNLEDYRYSSLWESVFVVALSFQIHQ